MKEKVKIENTEVLSDSRHPLHKVTYSVEKENSANKQQSHEVYNPGDACAILLYNKQQKTVVLTRQFRLPSFLNGNTEGSLIEACAGKIDDETPEESILREALEETGYGIMEAEKIGEAYMSPGSVTEKLHFFVAPYDASMKQHAGGGLEHEGEDIEVFEVTLEEAMQMIKEGKIKDGKTIILLQHAKLNNLV